MTAPDAASRAAMTTRELLACLNDDKATHLERLAAAKITEYDSVIRELVDSLRAIHERADRMRGYATGERPLKSATQACAWIAKESDAVLAKHLPPVT